MTDLSAFDNFFEHTRVGRWMFDRFVRPAVDTMVVDMEVQFYGGPPMNNREYWSCYFEQVVMGLRF